MTANLFLVSFPQQEEQPLHWWLVENGALTAQGCDADPLAAADISVPKDGDYSLQIVALVPSALSVVRWHDIPEDATEQQALAAAMLESKSQSLDPDELLVAAAREGDLVVTATLTETSLAKGLSILHSLGVDPDNIITAGFLVDRTSEKTVIADLGFEKILCGPRLIASDDMLVRDHLLSQKTVNSLEPAELDAMIASTGYNDAPNFRSGPFAKKTKWQLSVKQKQLLTWMVAALVLVSVTIPMVQLFKLYGAANAADNAAMAAAEAIVGESENLAVAEQRLDEKLLAENLGNNWFTVPAAGLFSALQQVPNVSVSKIAYGANGMMTVELTSVRNEDINPALIAIQDQGFVITATPRQDASGFAIADITVRVP